MVSLAINIIAFFVIAGAVIYGLIFIIGLIGMANGNKYTPPKDTSEEKN